jgi:hypothetical protein
MKAPFPKYSIRQNVWGNWYGYKSGRRVISFGNSIPGYGAQQEAERWLAGRQAEAAIDFLYRALQHTLPVSALIVIGYSIVELQKIASGPWPQEAE